MLPQSRKSASTKRIAKAITRGNHELVFPKLVEQDGGMFRIHDAPPTIFHPEESDPAGYKDMVDGVLAKYRQTLAEDRRVLSDRYRPPPLQQSQHRLPVGHHRDVATASTVAPKAQASVIGLSPLSAHRFIGNNFWCEHHSAPQGGGELLFDMTEEQLAIEYQCFRQILERPRERLEVSIEAHLWIGGA
jgi:hypothetical protein